MSSQQVIIVSLVVGAVIVAAVLLRKRSSAAARPAVNAATPHPADDAVKPAGQKSETVMTLEQQLAKLTDLGLGLDDGVTIDDILYSFSREDYEERPFDLILFVLGNDVERAPWGRSICSRVWNFDTECIGATGDYVAIVKRLCQVAGEPDFLTDVSDLVDMDAGKAWLRYKVNGSERDWPVEVNDDWADTLTLSYVMADIERDGRRFYFKDNGQAMVLFYLDSRTAAELNRLSSNALKPVLAE